MSGSMAVLKFAGRWLGPVMLLLAAYLFFFPPMPFVDASQSAALAGAIVTAIACIFIRAPELRRRKTILAIAALAALSFSGWRYWELRRGYHEETVLFDNKGAHLEGTLYLPDKPGKNPGMVFLSGSGAAPRSLFRGYAAHFAHSGYVVLVYDKRGTGESSGKYQAEGYFDVSWNLELLSDDAAAGLSFLASRPEVRTDAVGFVGLSEGGLIAPRAAALSGKAHFMLVLTSTTTSVFQLARFQLKSRDPRITDDQALAEAKRYFGKDFDPLPSLRTMNIPGLWVLAGQDTHDPNGETVRIIEGLRQIGKHYEYRVIPEAWHGLFIGPKKQVLATIDQWLARVTRAVE
jgi:uncharacterized protein